MAISKVIYSSKNDEWTTPDDLFNKLNAEFNFTLDAAASNENYKVANYYTIQDDGLRRSWGGEIVFCNPPYSNINEWVKKAYNESLKPKTTIVLLIPARTDTKFFHKYIYHRSEIRFIRGRVHFSNSKQPAPFPSMIVIFRSAEE
jgi:site-specific DNA-methyltransferase (adenine-specific)